MSAGGDRLTPDVAFPGENIASFDEPDASARHEFGHIIGSHGLPAEIRGQAALGVIVQRAASKRLASRLLVIEQSPATPVEGPDRSDPRCRRADLPAEVVEHRGRYDLHRVQRPAGHLQEAELESEGHAVHRRAPT